MAPKARGRASTQKEHARSLFAPATNVVDGFIRVIRSNQIKKAQLNRRSKSDSFDCAFDLQTLSPPEKAARDRVASLPARVIGSTPENFSAELIASSSALSLANPEGRPKPKKRLVKDGVAERAHVGG